MMKHKTCGQCVFRAVANGGCPIANSHRSENDTACENFATEIVYCECCGTPILYKSYMVYDMTDPNRKKTICFDCQKNSGMCQTCGKGNYCDFQSNPSAPMPQMIMKQFRQGNAIIQTQVANPARIAETCAKNCNCYDPEVGCCRTEGMCAKWKEKSIK